MRCYPRRVGETRLALEDTVQAHLKTLGPQLETLQRSPNSTIVPPELNDTAGRRAMDLLVPVRALGNELELRDTIGEGGMGVVHSATQRSLGRPVAIKTLRPENRTQQDVLTLLREAWVTGSLEHPNVLPIYDVKLDEKGLPLVVLKRIEGQDWGAIMHHADAMAERFGEGDLLEHNLEVLMQVCRAIAFAHSRGIIHRDIKPDNVRIGSFGEVYVLDWGIAVALEDDGTGRFPLAVNATAMAGTPSYMAPEMLGGEDAEPLTARTDIYLLGATLFEIGTGHPPHDGRTAEAVILSVLTSEPDLEGVPAELAAVVRRCMAPDPELRFESAEAVRNAVRRFLDHRGSDKLARDASVRLSELETLVGEGAGEEVRVDAHDLLGACRAGFSAALDVWPENETARTGLNRAITSMIDYELRRGDGRAASALLEQLDHPPDDLAKRVERGVVRQREAEEKTKRLEKLGKDFDPRIGTRTRMVVSAVIGALWCIIPLVGQLTGLGKASYGGLLAFAAFAIITALALFVWARESFTKTAFNRRIAGAVLVALASHFVIIAGGWLGGRPPASLTPFYPLVWSVAVTFVSIMVDRKLWPTALTYMLVFLGASRWPEKRFYLMSLGNAVLTLNVLIAWRPRRDAPPSSELDAP
jgi:serine/threonine-protein kinase